MKRGWLTLKSIDKWGTLRGVVPLLLLCVVIHYWSHVENGWVNLGLRTQSLWERLLNMIGDDQFNLYVYGLNGWTIFLYWSIGLAFLLAETCARPKWLLRYKVQPKAIVDQKRLYSLITTVLVNQFFVNPPYSIVSHYILEYQGTLPPIRELPTFQRFVIVFAILITTQEVVGYYTHRLFHHRLIYKWTHKLHHQWTAPIALSAYYNRPLDHLIVNMIPATIGWPLTNAHFSHVWYGRRGRLSGHCLITADITCCRFRHQDVVISTISSLRNVTVFGDL